MKKHLFLFFALSLFSLSAFAQLLAPSGLTATQLTATSVRLNWTDNATTETGFSVEYTAANGATFVNTQSVPTANAVTATVTGLTAGATYQFRVKAVSGVSSSPASSSVTFTSTHLRTPYNLVATQTSTSTAAVTWADTSLTETGFYLEYTAVDGATFVNNKTINTPNATTTDLTGLTAGVYKVRIRAFDSVNPLPTGGPISAEATLTIIAPPAAPTGIGVFQPDETKTIEVGWADNATNENGYELEYTSDGITWTKIELAANTVARAITNVTVLRTYQVRVRAYRLVSTNRIYSTYAGPVSIYIKDLSPLAPSDLYIDTALSTKNTLTIKWKDNANNEQGFELFINGVSSGYIAPNLTQYTVGNLIPNTDYVFQLKAYNNNATKFSNFSNSAGGRTLKEIPPAVKGLQTEKICATYVKLFWLDTSNEDVYTIERSSNGGASYIAIDTRAANEQFYTDTKAPANTLLHYRIRATNNGGSSYSSPIVLRTLALLPAQPVSNFQIAKTDTTSITLNWKNGSEDTDCLTNTRLGLQVWVLTEGKNSFDLLYELGKNDSVLVMNNLPKKTKYSITIRSVAAGGDSPFSDTLSTRTLGRPFAPTNLNVVSGIDALGNPNIKLVWKDNSEDEDNFVIEMAKDPNFLQVFAKTAPNVNFFTHTPVEEGVQWYYRVHAVNKFGISDYTLLIAGMVEYSKVPNIPYDLRGKVIDGKAVLTWKDDSIREEKFEIERSDDNGATFALINSVERNSITYTDETIASGKDYTYRVKASNSKGSSDYSNTVKISNSATHSIINSNTDEDIVTVFPNPTAYSLKIRMTSSLVAEGGRITIIDNNNRKIYETAFNSLSHEELEIVLENQKEGLYIVTIETQSNKISKRIYKR